jgi:hypothetical protein
MKYSQRFIENNVHEMKCPRREMKRDEKIPISSKVQGRNYFPNA